MLHGDSRADKQGSPTWCSLRGEQTKVNKLKKQINHDFLYFLLTVHLEVILDNNQLNALFLSVFISRLYMLRTSAHHQEDQIVLIHLV